MTVNDFMKIWVYGSAQDDVVRIHVTHTDLDGYGCVAIADRNIDHLIRPADIQQKRTADDSDWISAYNKLPEEGVSNADKAIIIHADHSYINGVIDEISSMLEYLVDEKVMILITDFSFKEEVIKNFLESHPSIDICVLDHHPTCPDYGENFHEPFSYLKDASGDYSGTKLCVVADVNFTKSKVGLGLRAVVDYINEYDNGKFGEWFNKYHDQLSMGMKLNYAFKFMTVKLNWTDSKMISNALVSYVIDQMWYHFGSEDSDLFSEINSYIDKKLRELTDEVLRYEKMVKPFTLPGVEDEGKIILSPRSGFFQIAKEYSKRHPEVPYLCALFMDSFTLSIASFRDEIHGGEIAKMLGGGGHPRAAGCTFQMVNLNFNVNGEPIVIHMDKPQKGDA